MEAGRLRHRVTFQRTVAGDDGYGNATTSGWATVINALRLSASFRPEFGREQLEAGRLEATLRGTLTVRRSSVTKTITEADRVVFDTAPYAGVVGNVRSIVPTPDMMWIEFVIEAGSAA